MREEKQQQEQVKKAYSIKEAREYIDDIKERLIHENRFFTEESFMYLLKGLFDKASKVIEENSLFYRARIYDESDKPLKKLGVMTEDDFEGYDKTKSFVNLTTEWPIYGRMHPSGIRVLYTASDEKTAAKELNPSVDELLSIATIKNDKPLRIADLSEIRHLKKDENENTYRIQYIIDLLTQGYSEKDYVFSQFIAGYCASQGFDGIGYRSKYSRKSDINSHNGINYTIFSYNKCHVISSKLFTVTTTALGMNPVQPRITQRTLNTKLKNL